MTRPTTARSEVNDFMAAVVDVRLLRCYCGGRVVRRTSEICRSYAKPRLQERRSAFTVERACVSVSASTTPSLTWGASTAEKWIRSWLKTQIPSVSDGDAMRAFRGDYLDRENSNCSIAGLKTGITIGTIAHCAAQVCSLTTVLCV